MRDQTLRIDVTRECLDQGNGTPIACAVALAARGAGIRNARAGYTTIAGHLAGTPVLATMPPEARSLVKALDQGEKAPPTSFQATFTPSP